MSERITHGERCSCEECGSERPGRAFVYPPPAPTQAQPDAQAVAEAAEWLSDYAEEVREKGASPVEETVAHHTRTILSDRDRLAAELARVKGERDEAREALKPAGAWADFWDTLEASDDHRVQSWVRPDGTLASITVADLRAARAIAQQQGGQGR